MDDTQIVTVTGYGSGGDGVARTDDGMAVFIRGAARGDSLEIELTKKQSRSARAVIRRVLSPSQHRIEPDCRYFPECGGCDFRHIAYEEELDAKERRVNDALKRIGRLSIRVSEVLTTGETEGYRNKAVFHTDGASFGFYKPQSNELVPIDRCLLLKDDLNDALGMQKEGLPELCEEHERTLPFSAEITLRSGRNGLVQPVEEVLDGLLFRVSGFFQVNTGAALLLFGKARAYAALSKRETLIDLYCGTGALTLFAGRDAKYALGVEHDRESVETARENARINGMANIEFICADVAEWTADGPSPDCVIVDPPRKGLSPGAVKKTVELAPKRIVYVSCDPATLARDIRLLDGYTLKDICIVDMFPRTANVECCCLLTANQVS